MGLTAPLIDAKPHTNLPVFLRHEPCDWALVKEALCLTGEDRLEENVLRCLGSAESKEFRIMLQITFRESRIVKVAENGMCFTHPQFQWKIPVTGGRDSF